MYKTLFIFVFSVFFMLFLGTDNIKAQEGPPIFQQGQFEPLNPGGPSQSGSIQQPGPPPPPPGQNYPPPPPGIRRFRENEDEIMANLERALGTAKKIIPLLNPGKVWISRAPGGEVEIKGAVLYKNIAVAPLFFSTMTADVLPVGYKPQSFSVNVSMDVVSRIFKTVLTQIEAVNGAEFCMPEYCWIVPVSFKGKIVFKLKIYYDGIHVVPDYPVNQEMNYQY